MEEQYDVVIIGGSYAGMSAAMALGRSRRKVLIVDGGDPCNKPTPHSHNFLTHDGATPSNISAIAKDQVLQYPTVHWHDGSAYDIMGQKDSFEVAIDGGKAVFARRVILAGGLKDVLPDIPGFKECWGKTIIHCPYCHGYEFKDQKTGILVPVKQAFDMVKLISNWTNDLKLFLIGNEPLDAAHLDEILDHGFQVISDSVVEAVHENGTLRHVILEDGSIEIMDALYARLPFEQKVSFVKTIGCAIMDSGHIEVDMFGKTTVEGIYAIGDCAHPMRSVATAVYTGNIAGAMLNKELIEENY
ncbi:NAD(P)/FAD-dependent oxidoreductase [Ekhidna sp.]|uniref:NAD(P)/FAD-dependent oxidoreductase n=1 Tax=Ekhidna sp. TaxID=2608089 RepID=UPI003C7C7085